MKNEITESGVNLMTKRWVYAPLIFSAFYFASSIFQIERYSATDLFAILGVYIAFIAVYSKAQNTKPIQAYPYIILLAIICVIGCHFSSGPMALFGYISFVVSFYYRPAISIPANFSIFTLITVCGFIYFTDYYGFFLVSTLVALPNSIIGYNVRRQVIQRLKEEKTDQQIEQLATIAERERIARDLHDLLGHTLSSIALKADLAAKLGAAGKTEQALVEIEQVATITRETLSEVRQAVSGYKTKDLSAELNKLQRRLEDAGFITEFNVDLPKLNAKSETNLLLILREAVTNIIRHSNGNQVCLTTDIEQQQLTVRIGDNGNVQQFTIGNGLTGIEERINQLSGKLVTNTSKGFQLQLYIPIQPSHQTATSEL